jgi:hypothetical protein
MDGWMRIRPTAGLLPPFMFVLALVWKVELVWFGLVWNDSSFPAGGFEYT